MQRLAWFSLWAHRDACFSYVSQDAGSDVIFLAVMRESISEICTTAMQKG